MILLFSDYIGDRDSDGSHYRAAFHVGDSRKRSFIAPILAEVAIALSDCIQHEKL